MFLGFNSFLSQQAAGNLTQQRLNIIFVLFVPFCGDIN